MVGTYIVGDGLSIAATTVLDLKTPSDPFTRVWIHL